MLVQIGGVVGAVDVGADRGQDVAVGALLHRHPDEGDLVVVGVVRGWTEPVQFRGDHVVAHVTARVLRGGIGLAAFRELLALFLDFR